MPEVSGIAFLKYKGDEITLNVNPCTEECIALNCPFQNYPEGYVPSYRCTNVYNALSLLVPTPPNELPDDPQAQEFFFDFIFNPGPTINSVKNGLPDIPFDMSDGPVPGECAYSQNPPCGGVECPHAVYVNQIPSSKSIEFVFSSLPRSQSEDSILDLGTHPNHMHGHSYWVTKIAYPEYFANGTIKKENSDIEVPDCGHGDWSEGRPHITPVNDTTIRKDVIIIPAGGYVVVRFRAKNPGWWIMHCHIDPHLNNGMAISIGEETECINPPPDKMMDPTAKEFCWSVEEFKEKEKHIVCPKGTKKQHQVIPGKERFIPNKPGEELYVKSEMDKEEWKGAGEEWRNTRFILEKYKKKMQKCS
ncbi:multicopper oxidase abr1-like [Dendronephthya gigantea]|uniref:multicopper oxidase abr1-like n=1 Tax=Dendronephthya gigantea TaxID=151771 RepID=UPI00106BCAFD|nr:multicopper oxidase abr1-like [Dendronephthya gigantea]